MREKSMAGLRRRPALPFLAIAANWALILGAAALGLYAGGFFVPLCAVVIIGARQHALFVLIHEAAHFHLARAKRLNDWTSDLFCAFPLFFDTEVYRKNHLKHHAHLNSENDPDWVRKVGQKQWTFPATLKDIMAFAPYFVFFAGAREWGIILWRFSGFADKGRWQAEPWFLSAKLAYFVAVFALGFTFAPVAFLTYWLVPMFFVLPAIGRIRSIAEHFAVSYSDEYNSSRDVTAGWIEGFIFAPYNVHFHLTHHLHPHVPFYNLREAHRRIHERDLKSAHINRSYILPFKGSVLGDMLHAPVVQKNSAKKAA